MDEKIGMIRFELSKLRYENVEIFKILEKLHKTVKHLHRTSAQSLEASSDGGSGDENEPPPALADLQQRRQRRLDDFQSQCSSSSPDVEVGDQVRRSSFVGADEEEDDEDYDDYYYYRQQCHNNGGANRRPSVHHHHHHHGHHHYRHDYASPLQPTTQKATTSTSRTVYTSGVQKSVNQHLKKAIITIKKHKQQPMNLQYGGFSQPKVLSPVTISPILDRRPSAAAAVSGCRTRPRDDYYERQQLIENLNDLRAELDLAQRPSSHSQRDSATSESLLQCPKSFCRQHLVKLVSSGDKPMACRLTKTASVRRSLLVTPPAASDSANSNSATLDTAGAKMLCEKNLQLIRIKLNNSGANGGASGGSSLVNKSSFSTTSSSCSSTASNASSSAASNDLSSVVAKNAQKLANNSNYVYYQHLNNQNATVKRHLMQSQLPFCNEIFYI